MEKKFITANGVNIYSYPSPYLHSFCICLYVKAGVLYEKENENGISHFWEHIEFKNLDKVFGGELNKIIDQHGLNISAATYKEFIYFKISGGIANFNKASEIIAKILMPLQVEKEDIDKERKRIKRELIETDDKNSLDFFTNKIVWRGSKLDRNIIGTNKNIDHVTLKKLVQKKEELLTPDNFFFYITGSFNEENIDFLSHQIDLYNVSMKSLNRGNLVDKPINFQSRNAHVEVKSSRYTCIRFSFDIKTADYSLMELDLMYDILFSGESSRFHDKLSNNLGLVYSFDATIERYSNYGVIFFEFEVSANNVYASMDATVKLLSELKNSISENDLKLVLSEYVDNFEIVLDQPARLNWEMAYNRHILNTPFRSLEESKEAYRGVTPERLREVAQEIFRFDNLVVSIKGNKKKIDIDRIRTILKGI